MSFLLEKRQEVLDRYQGWLDSKQFSAQRNAEFQAELASIDLKISEARASEVADKSHRGAPTYVPGHTGTQQRNVNPETEVRAYDLFLRRGLQAVQADEELRTYAPLNSTDITQGQFLVPITTGPEIEKKLKSVGAILSILRYFNSTTGEPINWPTSDDTAEKGEFIAENGPVSQSNPVFGNVTIGAFQWSSKQVLVPVRLLQDSRFDLVAHLTDLFGERAGRGFSDRVFNDPTDGLLNITGTGLRTAASSTVLNYFEPLQLQGAIDLGYNLNGTYVMNQTTYLGYRALVSTTGQALWPASDYNAGFFHGKPFIIAQDMPSFGTSGNKYVAYGNFQKVLFRAAGDMSVFRFNETFMNNLQQGFQAYQRISSKCLQPAAISFLKAA